MSENTTAWLAIGISALSIVVTVVNVLLVRATKRRMEATARGEIFGVDFK